MENSSRVMKERLGFFEIIKESLKIPFKNPNFILFTFLTSLPLFCFLVLCEIIIQHILIETGKILQETADPFRMFGDDYLRLLDIGNLLEEVSPEVLLLGFFYLGILHCLDLFNTIATVDVASIIYAGEKSICLKDMFFRPVKETSSIRKVHAVECHMKHGDCDFSPGREAGGCSITGWNKGGSSLVVTAVHISLVCLSNVLKWVSILVYFNDCKKQSAYEHTDVEEAKSRNDLMTVQVSLDPSTLSSNDGKQDAAEWI
ncbi:hypothetical protein CRYUN_Cryun15aG0023900 [Craigia yunnanensis]